MQEMQRDAAAPEHLHVRPFKKKSVVLGDCVQAHGGSMMEHDGVFYWYGEKKDGLTYNTTTNG